MRFTDNEAIELIKKNASITTKMQLLRNQSKELYALINGDNFKEELIDRIEHIEGEKKSIARKKYARDIQDLFERLFQPIDNIFYATGGNKVYKIDDEEVKTKFLKQIDNIKDSNTLSHWIQNIGIKLSHVDPNGLTFMEYRTNPKSEIYPTYKSINDIRCYESRGQLVEYVLFEPKEIGVEEHKNIWRFVDDVEDRVFIQQGETFIKDVEKSFVHPFKEVPALINSNVAKIGGDYRISPISPILGIVKEYARDQSIKTVYKFLQGFPIHWRYVTECDDCKGTGKTKEGTCKNCDGRGYLQKSDVTDMVTLPTPTQDSPTIAPNIAGHISPDIETWQKYNDEQQLLERIAIITHWGTPLNSIETFGGRKTTTEVLFNKQPIENRLNKYADYCEFLEWKMSDWVLRFIDRQYNEKTQKITITYGRNYVIEPSDTILSRYEEAKKNQENDVILDELFKQYLQAAYRTNPIELSENILKSEIEPYLHQTLKDIFDVFGQEEAQRKVLFSKWWSTLLRKDYNKGKDLLILEYDVWFEKNKKKVEEKEVAVKPEVNIN
jgi:hypothetical protein